MPAAHRQQAFQFHFTMPAPAFAAQFFNPLHRPPLVEYERLDAGTKLNRLGGAMPAVFCQQPADMDQFFAMRAEVRPKNHVAHNRKIQRKLTRHPLSAGFHQRGTECLIANLRFPFQKIVAGQHLNLSVRLPGVAEVLVIFVNTLIQAPPQSQPAAIRKQTGHHFVKLRPNRVVGVKDLQIFRLVGKIEGAIEIAEQAEVGRITDKLAGDALEAPDDFVRAVGRAVVQHHNSVRTQRLSCNGIQGLFDELFAVADGNGSENF